jgi:hypothetical protein
MSASTIDTERPLRVVWSAEDAEQIRTRVIQSEKNRFSAFLSARDLLLGAIRSAGSTLSQMAEKLHLGGARRFARRATGWVLGGLAIACRSLRTPGLLPGIGWLLSTEAGQRVTKAVGSLSRTAASAVLGVVTRAFRWTVGLLGTRAAELAEAVGTRVATRAAAVKTVVARQALLVTGLLPLSAFVRVAGTICRERALRSLLGRFLSRRWSILARVAINLALLPPFVRREVVAVMAGLLVVRRGAVPVVVPTGDTGPQDDPTPPASPAAGVVVDLEAERVNRDLAALDQDQELAPSMQRHPAGRSQHAKRKR